VIIHNGGYVGDDLCNQVLAAACEAGIPDRIMIFHNDFYRTGIRKLLYRGYDRMIDKCATKLVTVSQYTKNRILSSSYLQSDIKVIYNGITLRDTLSSEEKLSLLSSPEKVGSGAPYVPGDSSKLSLLMIGNFSYVKGHILMLNALAYLRDTLGFSDWHLTIMGNIYEKSCYDECISFIRDNSLTERVTIYHGIHNASEYTDLYDIALVPSKEDESFGLISVEAMAKGTPVVATACGGIPEVAENGRDGFVVPLGDAPAFAEAIKKLADSPSLRREYSANCIRDYNERFTPIPMGQEYLKLLKK
ncbi:MAG: glycosyltransferase family 4 protein, partial [Lachnospiraceae bacterium]|nr:glycosyltransferase family 4 protein [Lachnospiraceae bacterium]